MDQQTRRYYETRAGETAERFERTDRRLINNLDESFTPGMRVLDVGSGSGRDCAYLLSKGVDAYGIEPATALYQEELRRHPELDGRIQNADLLSFAAGNAEPYDGILLSAVLMHIPDESFPRSIEAIRTLSASPSVVVAGIATARNDIDPETERDPHGRLYRFRSAADVRAPLKPPDLLSNRQRRPRMGLEERGLSG